jgi:hypothetical protein
MINNVFFSRKQRLHETEAFICITSVFILIGRGHL